MDRLVTFSMLQQEPWLMLLAVCIAVGGSFAVFTIYSHLLVRGGAHPGGWLLLTGLCAGTGIWAAQLTAILAGSGIARGYNPVPAFAAFALAVLIGTVGVSVSLRPGRAEAAAGGGIVGAGMAATHIALMRAFIAAETLPWRPSLTFTALLIGITLGAAAWLAFRELIGRRGVFAGAVLFAAAICLLHLTAMAGINPNRVPVLEVRPGQIDGAVLGALAAAIAAAVLTAGHVAAVMDRRAMRQTFSHLGEVTNAALEGLVLADNGRVVSVNARLLELTGRKAEDLTGKKVFGELLAARRRTGGGVWAFETSIVAKGSVLPVQVRRQPLHAMPGIDEVFAIRDLRDREAAEARLAQAQKELRQREQELRQRSFLLENVLGNMSEGLCMYDADQRVVISNERYSAIYGLPPGSARPGRPLRDIIQERINKGLFAGPSPKAYLDERLAPVLKVEDSQHELNDGRIIAVSRRPMPGGGWVTMHEDITQRRRTEEKVLHLAQRDQLTELPNRSLFQQMLNEALVSSSRQNRRLAVLILDIDRFREVNDTLGHAVGSTLLQAIADRLRGTTRKTSILGRFGDDEFALVEMVEHPGRDAAALAGRIQDELRAPFKVDGNSIEICSTIGIAVSPADGTDADTLLRSADLALYHAKAEERGSSRFFEQPMARRLKEKLALERDVSTALERDEFDLHYQPLVNLQRNEVSGFEALLRWNHPKRGLILPADFMPAAQEARLITAISEWALGAACREATAWPNHLKVAVNIAPDHFRTRDFVRSVVSTLATSGLTAERLELEIAEGVIQQSPDEALGKLRQLSDLGVRIALDDFGAGFASLSYLRQFRFHRIKIDRAFVSGLTEDSDSKLVVRTLARLGAGFQVATTAEGVETKEQLDIVRAEGCTEMQGYYFSPPKTSQEVRALFLKQGRVAGGAVA